MNRPLSTVFLLLGSALLVLCYDHSASAQAADVQISPHQRDSASGDWSLLYTVDFGREGPDLESGAMAYDGSKSVRYVTWRRGMVRMVSRPSDDDPLTRDFMEGEDAVLVLATDSTSAPVRCVLTLGDAEMPRGPMRILVENTVLVPELKTHAGEFLDVEFQAVPSHSRIEVHVSCELCGSFAMCAASVYGSTPRRLFELPGVGNTLSQESLRVDRGQVSAGQVKSALHTFTEFLISSQPAEGCYAYSGNWYESAYPLRTLLVAAKLLNHAQYRQSAFECLDRFVGEQGNDGGWSAQYFGRKDCPLAKGMQQDPASRNLADVGTMALTLCMAIPDADGKRRASYLHAAVRFAETMVLPNQLPSGAFPNLEFKGRMHRHPYSVATGVQAANLAALFAVTREKRYQDAAVRAARFLCRSVVDDGRILFYPFDSDEARVLEPDALGEIYYILEGLLWVDRYGDAATRREIRQALDRYFDSPWGIATWALPAEWLSAENPWESSKRAGFLFLLSQYVATGKSDPELRQWMELNIGALCDRNIAPIFGVLSDPALAEGRYAMFATSLAGMGMASVIEPAAFFPIKDHRRP